MITKKNIYLLIKNFVCGLFICLITITMFGCEKEQLIEEVYPNNDNYYQVFVRSFADSDNDGIGDFNGITAKLDYLKELGITGLWLMPIHPSTSYHGYDVTDYYNVNSDYGTLEDFKNLCTKAKEKGINIMIDMVINHTSNQHEWFKKALEGDEKYKDYYVFTTLSTKNLVGSWSQNIWHSINNQKYCGYFSNTMPDLNFFNSEVINETYNIGKFWIDLGVGGFRLDAAQHFFGTNEYIGVNYDYFENIRFLKKYTAKMKEYDPNFYITGEINLTTESIVKEYFRGIDSPLDFPIAKKVFDNVSKNGNFYYVRNIIKNYDSYKEINANFISAPFLHNHDEDRLASAFKGDMNKLRFAAEMLLTLPGSPIIYYGEEIGMYGSKSNGEVSNNVAIWDETRRLPIDFGDDYTTTWFNDRSFNDVILNESVDSVKEQLISDDSLLQVYKTLLNLRNNNIALKYGNNIVAYENNNTQLQGFYREFEFNEVSQKILVIHNLSISEIDLPDELTNGKIIYLSGTTDYASLNLNSISKLAAKSTIIIDVTGGNND